MIQKLFFFIGLLFISNINAQVLSTYGDNFESLNLGNIQDQGNMPHTWHHNGGDDAKPFFQVEDTPAHGRVMAITGPSGSDAWLYTSASKNIWRNAFGAAWNARTAGNNVVVVEFDFNPGLASASQNNFSIEIMGNNDTPVAGLTIGKNGLGIGGADGENRCHVMYASTFTQGIAGDSESDPIKGGNSGYGPYAAEFTNGTISKYRPLFVDDYNKFYNDTWIRLSFSYDFTASGKDGYFDGKFRAKLPQGASNGGVGTGANPYSTHWNPCTATEEPTEVDFFAYTGPNNTVSATAYFDNIVVKATNETNNLLSVESRTRSVLVSTYPNPTTDVINIYNSNNLRLSKYELRDIKGSVMKYGSLKNIQDQKINVSDLSAGVYLLNMNTEDNSTVTKKIIKQ